MIYKMARDKDENSTIVCRVELTDITDTDMQTGMKEMKKEDLMRCVWRWYWKRGELNHLDKEAVEYMYESK